MRGSLGSCGRRKSAPPRLQWEGRPGWGAGGSGSDPIQVTHCVAEHGPEAESSAAASTFWDKGSQDKHRSPLSAAEEYSPACMLRREARTQGPSLPLPCPEEEGKRNISPSHVLRTGVARKTSPLDTPMVPRSREVREVCTTQHPHPRNPAAEPETVVCGRRSWGHPLRPSAGRSLAPHGGKASTLTGTWGMEGEGEETGPRRERPRHPSSWGQRALGLKSVSGPLVERRGERLTAHSSWK